MFFATWPYNENNITDIETTLEEFQQTLYTYFRHNYGEHPNQSNWFKQYSNLSKSKSTYWENSYTRQRRAYEITQ